MQAWRWIEVRLSDRFPGLMLWHTVAVMAAVFAAKALLYWAADWLGLGPCIFRSKMNTYSGLK